MTMSLFSKSMAGPLEAPAPGAPPARSSREVQLDPWTCSQSMIRGAPSCFRVAAAACEAIRPRGPRRAVQFVPVASAPRGCASPLTAEAALRMPRVERGRPATVAEVGSMGVPASSHRIREPLVLDPFPSRMDRLYASAAAVLISMDATRRLVVRVGHAISASDETSPSAQN